MKKFLLVSLVLLSCFLLPSPSYAYDAWNKLGRGVGNVLFGGVEVVNQPFQMAKTERWPIAIFGGIPKGVLVGIKRIGVGLFETVTFPWQNPSGDYGPIMKPAFIVPAY